MAYVAPVMHTYHDPADAFLDGSQHLYHTEANAPMQDPIESAYYSAPMPPQISCDIKPRLTKEQHDFLENQFMKANKPNTNTKRAFSEQLHVSLDKVNNWFQNRRAKSKQDAKKAGVFANNSYGNNANFSDSDTSPAFVPPQFSYMMQQLAPEQNVSHALPVAHMPQMQQQGQLHNMQYGDFIGDQVPNTTGLTVPYAMQGMFDSPQEMNRRTLTQEQFDALAPNGIMDSFHNPFSNDANAALHLYDGQHQIDFRNQNDLFTLSDSYGAALSSEDSTVPSTTSEHSLFPVSSLTEQSSNSTSPENWADSHHPSLSGSVTGEHFSKHPSLPATTQTSTWQRGQSKPVDINSLQKEFEEAQAQSQTPTQQFDLQQQTEQAYPQVDEDALLRRDSQTSTGLTQQMSEFALQTPLSDYGQFKPPGPTSSSIAARRHVKRPAQLGVAALRSVSYSGHAQANSPGTRSTQQPLRRIQSSVAMNTVAGGRVTKGSIAAPQKSPLGFQFENLNSPKALRHASTSSNGGSSLAPPTPLSPREIPPSEQFQGLSRWPSAGQVSHQDSISETDAEHAEASFLPPASAAHPLNFSSPPHTPMYSHNHQQFFGHQQHQMILENTPPQSAPACQQTFPASSFMMPQQPTSMPPPPVPQPQLAHPAQIPEQQQVVNVCMPEHQYLPMVPMQPGQQFMGSVPAPTPEQHMQPIHFAPDGTVISGQGTIPMMPVSIHPQAQPMHFLPYTLPPNHAHISQQPMPTPPQYSFVSADGSPNGLMAQAGLPKGPASELFVHEYTPPRDLKNAAAPRSSRSVDAGPKAYSFANQGPEHFEKKDRSLSKKGSVASSSSPASSASSIA